MGARRNQKLITSATPHMQPGEQVELIALGKVGSAKKATARTIAASAAATVVSTALGGPGWIVGYAQREMYLVLTDRQLLLFASSRQTGGPGKHLTSIPRNLITCTEPASSMSRLKITLTIGDAGAGQQLALTFPPLPPALRKQGRLLADALPRAA